MKGVLPWRWATGSSMNSSTGTPLASSDSLENCFLKRISPSAKWAGCEEFRLLRRRFAPQRGVARGEAAEPFDHPRVLAREVEVLGEAQRLEPGDAQRLRIGVLRVHQRHQQEGGALGRQLDVPAAFDAFARQRFGERIGGEGAGIVAEDVAAELVEQDDRREQRLRLAAPAERVVGQHRVAQRAEPLANPGVERRIGDEAAFGRRLVEPEAQHRLRRVIDFANAGP